MKRIDTRTASRRRGITRCRVAGKLGHLSRLDAKRFADRMHPGERMQVWPCGHCGLFHIGHASEHGTRQPWRACRVDTLPVFTKAGGAHAYQERMGPKWMVAACGDHWHVCPLPQTA